MDYNYNYQIRREETLNIICRYLGEQGLPASAQSLAREELLVGTELVQSNRLPTLIEQSLNWQFRNCSHNSVGATLLNDHECTPSSINKRRGLENPGNLCFFNTTLQALLSCSPFVEYIQRIQVPNDLEVTYPTLTAFSKFITQPVEQHNSTHVWFFDPVLVKFKTPVQQGLPIEVTNIFGRSRQEDVPEFLAFLLNNMISELHEFLGSNYSSQLFDIFKCQLVRGNHPGETNLMIPLAIPNFVWSIKDGLDMYFETGLFQTGGTPSKIQTLPSIMILQLNRFSFDRDTNLSTKVSTLVDFPLKLNLADYVTSPNNEGLTYELVATITHHGEHCFEGHYTANTRQTNGGWLNCDDAIVTPIESSNVLDGQAYVLFYQQVLENTLTTIEESVWEDFMDCIDFHKESNQPPPLPLKNLRSVQCKNQVITDMQFHPELPVLLLCNNKGGIILHKFDIEAPGKSRLRNRQAFSIWNSIQLSQFHQDLFQELNNKTEGGVCVAWGNNTTYGVGFCEGLVHIFKYSPYEPIKKHLEVGAHLGAVNQMSFSTCEEKLLMVTCGNDKFIKVWDVASHATLTFSYNHPVLVNSLAMHYQSEMFLVFTFSDVEGNNMRMSDMVINLVSKSGTAELKLSRDGERLFSCIIGDGDGDPLLMELDLVSHETRRVYKGVTNTLMKCMDVCNNHFIGVLCAEEKCIKFWEVDSEEVFTTIKVGDGSILESSIVRFNREGSLLAVLERDQVRVLASNELIRRMN